MKLKKLPIGISTLKDILNDDYLYVDKTAIAQDLIENGQYYFLSRPRRFGKSLFLDTLKSILNADIELFKDLYIGQNGYEFKKYPIIHLIMSNEFLILNDLKKNIQNQLVENGKKYNIVIEETNPNIMFSRLLQELYVIDSKKVVVLIDDADKPLREKFFDTDFKEIHSFLLSFYMTTKDCEYIQFAFMTGVHPLKGDMLFGFNHLLNISLDKKYATICGYTQNDVETVFANHLAGQDFEKIKLWYNGYKFLGEGVYNPFDILLFISNNFIYESYWFSTATPTFLLKLIEKNNYFLPDLEHIVKDRKMLESFDVDYIELETLMWQTGYLTIANSKSSPMGYLYELAIPNQEVRLALLGSIADFMSKIQNSTIVHNNIYNAIVENDLEKLEINIKSLFASIPYNLFTNNKMYEYEGYYVSVFYAYIKALGLDLVGEDVTNKGRIDLTIKLPNAIYIIEFKTDGSDALEQIKEKNYHEKYLSENKDIYLIGIEFDTQKRNISKVEWEKVDKNESNYLKKFKLPK